MLWYCLFLHVCAGMDNLLVLWRAVLLASHLVLIDCDHFFVVTALNASIPNAPLMPMPVMRACGAGTPHVRHWASIKRLPGLVARRGNALHTTLPPCSLPPAPLPAHQGKVVTFVLVSRTSRYKEGIWNRLCVPGTPAAGSQARRSVVLSAPPGSMFGITLFHRVQMCPLDAMGQGQRGLEIITK